MIQTAHGGLRLPGLRRLTGFDQRGQLSQLSRGHAWTAEALLGARLSTAADTGVKPDDR